MAHWLMKSEPESYGWDDLVRDGGTEWDGVRNNAARLHLKAMKPGDEAFFYHSMSDKAVVGIMRITREAEPDPKDARLGSGPRRAGAGAGAAGHARGDQGRAEARQDGADPPVAPLGRAGARRRVGQGSGDGGPQMILLALAVSAAQPAETPRRFLDRIYAGYKHSDFSPLVHPDRYFAPPLVAAIRGGLARLAHGEVGYLDGDPLRQCQDASGLRARIRPRERHWPRACDRGSHPRLSRQYAGPRALEPRPAPGSGGGSPTCQQVTSRA